MMRCFSSPRRLFPFCFFVAVLFAFSPLGWAGTRIGPGGYTITGDVVSSGGAVLTQGGFSIAGTAGQAAVGQSVGAGGAVAYHGVFGPLAGQGAQEGEGVVEGEGEPEGMPEGEGEGIPGHHSADQDGNNQISLTELLRVIQFFNTGGLHCVTPPATSEDGYLPGAGVDHSCAAHSSDYNPLNWQISLTELLRLIQFFNTGAYHACPGQGTEDDYCPGPY